MCGKNCLDCLNFPKKENSQPTPDELKTFLKIESGEPPEGLYSLLTWTKVSNFVSENIKGAY